MTSPVHTQLALCSKKKKKKGNIKKENNKEGRRKREREQIQRESNASINRPEDKG